MELLRTESVFAFISRLHAADIHVKLTGEQLKISGSRQYLSPDILEEIKDRKADIISYLEGHTFQKHNGIPLIEEQEYYAASHAQRRMWLLHQSEETRRAYNITAALGFNKPLDVLVVQQAAKQLIARHESLRTTFFVLNGEVKQRIHDSEEVTVPVICLDIVKEAGWEKRLLEYIYEETAFAFDLEKAPLFNIALIRLEDDEYVFCLKIHHSIADAWSMQILLKELQYLYVEYAEGREPVLPPLIIQYRHYASWQYRLLRQNDIARYGAYWKQQLQGELPTLALPTDFRRPAIKGHSGSGVKIDFGDHLNQEVVRLSQQTETGVFMILAAALHSLLFRYTGQKDIITGMPVNGREHSDLEAQVGLYINTVVIRCRISGKQSFNELLKEVKQVMLDAYDNQQYPFDQLVEDLNLPGDRSRNPLFDVMITYEKEDGFASEGMNGAMTDISLQMHDKVSQFDLTYNFLEEKDGIGLLLNYNTELFLAERITRMVGHFKQWMQAVTANPDKPLEELEYLTEAEKDILLRGLNDTGREYPAPRTLKGMLEEQAARTPHAIAVCFRDNHLTYQMLHKVSNQLARVLIQKGITPETLVPVCLERSLDMIIAILAILKAGGAYVPIDPHYPQDRIRHMVKDTNAGLAICDASGYLPMNNIGDIEIYRIDEECDNIKTMHSSNIETDLRQSDMAYVIYTSGSTGNPKGVIIEHAAIVNQLRWAQDHFGLREDDTMLLKTTFCFDVSIWEFLWPLCTGARVVVAEPDGHRDNRYLKEIIRQQQVTNVQFVPSMMEIFLDDIAENDCPSLKTMFCCGESLKVNHVHSFRKKMKQVNLYNVYGPTEAAVQACCWSLPHDEAEITLVPIGKPVANTGLLVLDNTGRLVAQGFMGMLYIEGIQLARGYLNNPELTADKFIQNPYAKEGRLYNTGDIARWLWDGNLEFLGRRDDQVKIRGFRIELGEVTAALVKYKKVNDGVVTMEMVNNEPALIAYVIWNEQKDEEGLRNFMKESLPVYMHPAAYVSLTSFPRTASGKIDKKCLKKGDLQLISGNYEAAGNEMEERMIRIWEDLFQRGGIGVHDDFFSLGGHSLKGIRMISRIYTEFGIQIDLKTIFLSHDIRKLCRELKSVGLKEPGSVDQNNKIPVLR